MTKYRLKFVAVYETEANSLSEAIADFTEMRSGLEIDVQSLTIDKINE